jgi:hypothetical protein
MSPDELKDLGDRFTYYAKRARRLSLEEEVMDWNSGADFFTVDVNVLALWATRRNLFPRLQGLEISPRYLTRSPLHDALLPSFLQSRVARTLRWSINEEPAELFGRHHHVLEDICATVEELHLTMPEFETRPWRNRLGLGWATFTGRMLAHTARVRELHITTPITWTDLCLVGSLRTLQELKVTNVVHVPAAPLSMPDNALVNLSDLNLVDLSSEAQVSQAILSRPVNALEWVTVRLPDATTLEHISAVLVGALRQCQLYSLSIEIDEIVGATPTAEEMTSLFQSLPQSATLECLSFVFHQWVPMGITHIDAVLSRYLRLWIWKWERRSVRAVGCRLSLGDLVHLLHHRPMIRGLPIIINSQDIPTAEDVANFGEHRYNSPISIASHADGANLRKTLTHVFPRVCLNISTRNIGSPCSSYNWRTET